VIGSSPSLARVLEVVEKVAESDSTVLLTGESGSGKELIARAIHYNSRRVARMLVTVNCGAIPEELLESELFGHVRGAFTNAISHREGRFALADGGTIFLDEIGDMSPNLQVKLLRVLQERTFEPVGSSRTIRVDVRVIAATHQDIPEAIEKGRFREDLYYRLNVIQIGLPPLRERPEDVPLLVHHFLEKYSAELGKRIRGIADEALECLLGYAFPGNVRELENVIERAVALSRSDVIEREALSPAVLKPPALSTESRIPADGADLERMLASYERGLLMEALQRTGGIKKRAAQLLGVSFRSFRYRLEKLGLDESPAGES